MEKEIFTQIWVDPEKNGGATFNLQGKSPSSGYMVSLQGHEEILTKEEFQNSVNLLDYIQRKKNILKSISNIYVGVWYNEGKYYLDLSENIADKETALRLGIRRGQKAIWDIVEGDEISLPTPQRSGTMTQQQTYINLKVRELL